ncbi:MAG: AmmeMemoRadiSam system radical SAM enzyme, partial [Candidatus Thorarchaeota archaeon]
PTVFFEFAYDTAKLAHEKGLFNTFVTNGYMTPEAIEYISPFLDAASVNFKGSANKKFYSELMSVPKIEPIFTSMQVMKERNIFIEITNLIIPEVGDYLEDTRILSEWIVENLGEHTPFHLTAFSPTYKLTHLPRTSATTLEKHIEVAKNAGLVYIYSGNVAGHDYENTYCPECGFKAVERYSVYLGSNNLNKDGNCPRCKTDLNMKGVQWMKHGKGQFKRF